MALMRDHFEGTPFDLTLDVGAGPYACPYRWRPMTLGGGRRHLPPRARHLHPADRLLVRRAVRAGLPDPIGGVLWFGVDDTYLTVYVPMYCGIRAVPQRLRGRAWPTSTRSPGTRRSGCSTSSPTWPTRATRDMIVDVQKVQRELEGGFLADQPAVEAAAVRLYEQSPQLARDYLTDYSARQGEHGHASAGASSGEHLLVEVHGRQRPRHAAARSRTPSTPKPGTAPSCATRARGCGCPSRTRRRRAAPTGR